MYRILPLWVLLMTLGGCMSVQTFNYYRLNVEAPSAHKSVNGSVGVAPVKIPGWLESRDLSWSDGAYRVHRASNDRWGYDLDEHLSGTLGLNLRRQMNNKPVSVGPWLSNKRPDFRIELQIENLIMQGNQVSMMTSWRVKDLSDAIILSHDGVEYSVAVGSVKGVEGARVVEGLSQLLAQLSQDIAKQLPARQK